MTKIEQFEAMRGKAATIVGQGIIEAVCDELVRLRKQVQTLESELGFRQLTGAGKQGGTFGEIVADIYGGPKDDSN